MFSTKEQLDKRTGPYGIGRLSYLQSLVTEYQDTNSLGRINLYKFTLGYTFLRFIIHL